MKPQNNAYRAVIFDLDGTLLNTLADLTAAVNAAMAQTGFPRRTAEEVRRFIGNGIPALIRRCVPPDTPAQAEAQALALFRTYYNAHLCDHTAPYPGIPALLEALKRRGIAVGVATNKNHEAAQPLITRCLGSTVDVTVGRQDGVPPKPDPQAVLQAMRALHSDAAHTLYVGDSDVDVLTARGAGLAFVGVAWGYRDVSVLRAAGAADVIETPQELLRYV